MRVSVIASLIVAVHIAVIGSVVMTQGCTATGRDARRTDPYPTEPPTAPPLPPSATVVTPGAVPPVTFPDIKPPSKPAPVKTDVAAGNIYVVRSGDSLSKIAVQHGVNARELAELNQIADANKIRIGQKLILPDHAKPSQSQPEAKAAPKAKAAEKSGPGGTYEVKAGDSLSKIAAAHKVSTKDLAAANQITDPNKIRAGQKLTIPGGEGAGKAKTDEAKSEPSAKKKPAKDAAPVVEEAAPAAAEDAPAAAPEDVGEHFEPDLQYTVQPDDTVSTVAKLFSVREADLRKANKLKADQELVPNSRIVIPESK